MSSSRRTCLTCSSEVPALLKWHARKQALTVGMGLVIVQALWRCFCENLALTLSYLVLILDSEICQCMLLWVWLAQRCKNPCTR